MLTQRLSALLQVGCRTLKGRAVVQSFICNDAESKASCKCLVTFAELWASRDGSMVVQTTKQIYIRASGTNELKRMTLVALKTPPADVFHFKFERTEGRPATPMLLAKNEKSNSLRFLVYETSKWKQILNEVPKWRVVCRRHLNDI